MTLIGQLCSLYYDHGTATVGPQPGEFIRSPRSLYEVHEARQPPANPGRSYLRVVKVDFETDTGGVPVHPLRWYKR